jgi:hypothetical protein
LTKSTNTEQQRLADQAAQAAEREQEQRLALVQRVNERIESETERHYSALTRSQEDYALSRSRDEEDFQRQRQKLLAEGRIFEAQELQAEFALEQKRNEEDQRRDEARAAATLATAIADAKAELVKEGLAPGGLSGSVAGATPAAVPAATLAALGQAQVQAQAQAVPGTATLRIAFQPISLVLNGAVVATALYPDVEQRLDAALSAGIVTIAATSPVAGSGAVGGPRV